jgi:putative SOS response-associated peptidase YedK
MCGRFTIASERERVTAALPGITVGEWYGPRFNVAPGQQVPAVLNDGRAALTWLRWGLIPAWALDPAIGNRLINARAETLAEKPSFRRPLQRHRCLVLADGFYEWVPVPGSKARVPHYLKMKDGSYFTFAGLWDRWRDPDGHEVLSCTLITTEPNDLIRPLHDRMPVILPAEARAPWLDPEPREPADLLPLLRPYAAALMRVHPVSTRVNRPGFDDPSCIAPAPTTTSLPGFQ